ncbi:hypothetical protein EV361DRAFT_957264 [Lentinula raphanica]|nr:hypothetical protein EV361DRAFT_957264 [Lentinula raphanica]
MVSKVLQRLRLDINSDLDRFIPGRGWTPILMNTLFMVKDGDVVSLKSSTTSYIRPNYLFALMFAHIPIPFDRCFPLSVCFVASYSTPTVRLLQSFTSTPFNAPHFTP